MMNKIYISGPISGCDLDERRRVFGKIESCLSRNGYEVFKPLKNGLPEDAMKSEHMRTDIRNLTECDAIDFLPGMEVLIMDGIRAGSYTRMSMMYCFALSEERSRFELKCEDE